MKITPIVWRIHPVPDFLVDHTLSGDNDSEKLREVVSRWVQFIGSLWNWHDQAAFALRYVASSGKIEVYFLATPFQLQDLERLTSEVAILMRAHRLGNGTNLTSRSEEPNGWWPSSQGQAMVEVTQHTTRSLWKLSPSFVNTDQARKQLGDIPKQDIETPLVVYPWWAAGGPFLVPMESLLSQSVPVTLTIYLEPTKLKSLEWNWLSCMAREAKTKSDQTQHQLGVGAGMRVADPSAELAGRLYMENLRRLSAAPFMTTIHCTASNERWDVARSVASSMQSLIHEPPFDRPQQDEQRLPSGADLHVLDASQPSARRNQADSQYETLRFQSLENIDPLGRLVYLVDARGASTVFRLPVSVHGGVPGILVKQMAPDFHPGEREVTCPPDHLRIGTYEGGGHAFFPIRDLTKHALVTGFTGSGKTVTMLQILHQLWADHQVPFLVLESAKQEYRGLLSAQGIGKDIRVYTLGNEVCVPFRFNPFELLPGVRVEAHVSKLQTCFEAAIPPIGPSASVISEALLRVYEKCGWSLTDIYPTKGHALRRFPVLSEFVEEVDRVIDSRGYQGELLGNLRAAIGGRFIPLMIGSKKRMFDTQRSYPTPNELFNQPTILEMNDLSVDDKALMVMFLMTSLREHREQNRSRQGELLHITVVEEAHNILESVESKGSGEGATSADTRFKAVEFFSQMLTEIRALGEGLMIADQSPQKLAPDAIRNTNLQISHQLRDSSDRQAIARAMIMEPEQQDFLGKLVPGQAAVFRTGLEKATFVRVHKYYPTTAKELQNESQSGTESGDLRFLGLGFNPLLTDDQVAERMVKVAPHLQELRCLTLPMAGCRFCKMQCRFRDETFVATYSEEFAARRENWKQGLHSDETTTAERLADTIVMCREKIDPSLPKDQIPHAIWCVFAHVWELCFAKDVDRNEINEHLHNAIMKEIDAQLSTRPGDTANRSRNDVPARSEAESLV